MKRTILIFTVALCSLASCQSNQSDMHEHDHNGMGDPMEEDNTEVAPAEEAYICPMKCEGEKHYSHTGECPVCHMELEKQ